MKDILLALVTIFILTRCASKNSRNDKPVEVSVVKPDTAKNNSVKHFFDNPLRSLDNFDTTVGDSVFDQIIKRLNKNKGVQTITRADSCLGDCCEVYKELEDSASNLAVYLFKGDCGEYGFRNDQYLLLGTTLSKVRNFSVGIKDWPTDSTRTLWIIKESLFLFTSDSVLIKDREKTFTDLDKYAEITQIAFTDRTEVGSKVINEKMKEFKGLLGRVDSAGAVNNPE